MASSTLVSKPSIRPNQRHQTYPSDKASKPPFLHPAAVPLPPSPPATDALNLEEDLEPMPSPRKKQTRKPSAKPPISRARVRRNPASLASKRDREDDGSVSPAPRSIEPASPASSPINSPTTHKSHPSKRVRLAISRESSPSPPQQPQSPIDQAPDPFNPRDSPNNPFLVKPGEIARQPGTFQDPKSRKLVYIFRGKRIQYDPGEDLHNTGDSPFTQSAPKLLFPTKSKTLSPPPPLDFGGSPSTPKPRSSKPTLLPTPQSRSKSSRATSKPMR